MKSKLYLFALLFTASFIFTACDRDEPVTSVSLDHSTLTLIVGETEVLIATVTPKNADDKTVMWTSSNSNVASVDENGVITAVSIGTTTITARAGSQTAACIVNVKDGVRIADVIWATRNVDAPGTFAENPEDAGMFFQWNRLRGWSATGGVTGWNSSVPRGTKWYAENDPCPPGWRVPTSEQLISLHAAGYEWISNWNDTGANGRVFGTYPNQIFLPAVGWRHGYTGVLYGAGIWGNYWSNAQFYNELVQGLYFDIDVINPMFGFWRTNGLSVRCVSDN